MSFLTKDFYEWIHDIVAYTIQTTIQKDGIAARETAVPNWKLYGQETRTADEKYE